jgi:hypothetical protein
MWSGRRASIPVTPRRASHLDTFTPKSSRGHHARYAGTSVVLGLAGFDGMCRPLRVHAFVFIDGAFAGTLTPSVMNARSDGVESPRLKLSWGDGSKRA